MQLDLIASLQERFSLSPEQIENIKNICISALISKQKSAEKPTLIIVGGQEGSFKDNLKKIVLKELSNNAVVLSKEELRKYHPNFEEIQAQYPDMLRLFTEELAKMLLLNLENQAFEKRLNVLLESSLGNSETIIQKLNHYKSHQYQIDLRVVSINKMFSYLNSEETYEQMLAAGNLGRNISKHHHDKNFEAIETTLHKIQKKELLDKVEVYKVGIQEKNDVSESKILPFTKDKTKFIELYSQERNRDFTDMETTFLKSKAQNTLNMKIKREANFLEKVRFDSNFKFILEGKGMNGLRKDKGIKS
jgi:Zeta toxin